MIYEASFDKWNLKAVPSEALLDYSVFWLARRAYKKQDMNINKVWKDYMIHMVGTTKREETSDYFVVRNAISHIVHDTGDSSCLNRGMSFFKPDKSAHQSTRKRPSWDMLFGSYLTKFWGVFQEIEDVVDWNRSWCLGPREGYWVGDTLTKELMRVADYLDQEKGFSADERRNMLTLLVRICRGWNTDAELLMIHCDEKSANDYGMTSQEIQSALEGLMRLRLIGAEYEPTPSGGAMRAWPWDFDGYLNDAENRAKAKATKAKSKSEEAAKPNSEKKEDAGAISPFKPLISSLLDKSAITQLGRDIVYQVFNGEYRGVLDEVCYQIADDDYYAIGTMVFKQAFLGNNDAWDETLWQVVKYLNLNCDIQLLVTMLSSNRPMFGRLVLARTQENTWWNMVVELYPEAAKYGFDDRLPTWSKTVHIALKKLFNKASDEHRVAVAREALDCWYNTVVDFEKKVAEEEDEIEDDQTSVHTARFASREEAIAFMDRLTKDVFDFERVKK